LSVIAFRNTKSPSNLNFRGDFWYQSEKTNGKYEPLCIKFPSIALPDVYVREQFTERNG